jgi:hypothetical protein
MCVKCGIYTKKKGPTTQGFGKTAMSKKSTSKKSELVVILGTVPMFHTVGILKLVVLYIKVKNNHLFILGRGVEYKIVGQKGALGKDGFLEVGFSFGDLGGRGRWGSDHLLEEPLTERPQVRGAEWGGHPGNLHKQNNSITVLRIRIQRIHVFLGLLNPDPDPLVRGMDPDPDTSIIKKK